jgi:hypothetical protein
MRVRQKGNGMKKQWMPLDNAALIFPAVRRQTWVNVFRMAVTLPDDVDPAILQRAVNDLKPRFPSIYVHLGTGLFWYFLEEVSAPPKVRRDYAYPLTHMGARELRTCCFRVLYYKNRIAVEFFHSSGRRQRRSRFHEDAGRPLYHSALRRGNPGGKRRAGYKRPSLPVGAGGQLPAQQRRVHHEPGRGYGLPPAGHAGAFRLSPPDHRHRAHTRSAVGRPISTTPPSPLSSAP